MAVIRDEPGATCTRSGFSSSAGAVTARTTSASSDRQAAANEANAPGAATVSTVEMRNGPTSPDAASVSTTRRKLCIDEGVVSTIQCRGNGQVRDATWSLTVVEASLMMIATMEGAA